MSHPTSWIQRFLTAALTALLAAATVPAQADETITYIHWDALGSPVAATDEDGNVVWREAYRPYGERINHEAAAGAHSRWYTGHPQDADTGLVYAGARYYDPVIGRFLARDPVEFQEDDLHSFNRYAYGANNPYKYIDPDGRAKVCASAAVAATRSSATCGGGFGGGGSLGGTYKLRDSATGSVRRTGRTNDLDRRQKEHARSKDTKDLDFEVDRRSSNDIARRGREQRIYDEHPEADLNKRRPISPRNPRRDEYLDAGDLLE